MRGCPQESGEAVTAVGNLQEQAEDQSEGVPRRHSPTRGRGTDAERSRTLLEIDNAVISNLTRDSLFRAIAQALREVVPFARTALFLHDPEKNVLRLFLVETSLSSRRFGWTFGPSPRRTATSRKPCRPVDSAPTCSAG